MRSTVVCNSALHRQFSVAACRSIDYFDMCNSNHRRYSGRSLYSHWEGNKIDNFILQKNIMIKLKYGNTNTFFIKGSQGGLLIAEDPDMLALAFTAPITTLIHYCDREPEKELEIMRQIEAFVKHFIKIYMEY